MKKLIYSIATLLILTGCIEEFKASISPDYEDLLVVEGEITEGTSVFYLSKNFSLDEETLPEGYNDINAALFIIGDNGYRSDEAENTEKGVFKIDIDKLEDDVSYGIEIRYNGDTYQSAFSKPLHTPKIETVNWVQPVEKGEVIIQISANSDSNKPQYFMWDYKEDWEYSAAFFVVYFWSPTESYYDFNGPEYYCWRKASNREILVGSTESLKENRITNQKLFSIKSENERFSMLYSVLVTQRAISKGAYEFYQNKIKVNKEMGGLFTPQPSDIGGNIECVTNPSKKVIGYVETIKNVTEERLFIDKKEITRPFIPSNCPRIPDSERTIEGMTLTKEEFYNMGYRLITTLDEEPPEWATAGCAYCTSRGGTKDKPDFWPNDHK